MSSWLLKWASIQKKVALYAAVGVTLSMVFKVWCVVAGVSTWSHTYRMTLSAVGVVIPAFWLLFGAGNLVRCYLEEKRLRSFQLSFPFVLGYALACELLAVYFTTPLLSEIHNKRMTFFDTFDDTVTGGLAVAAFLAFDAYRKQQLRATQLERDSAHAKFHALKAQMQPHFLFNALNSISLLVKTRRPEAESAIQNLADLYRSIVRGSHDQMNPLSRELEIVGRYLEMEKIRFGARLSYAIDVDESALNVEVPALALQTLVENSVKHGVSRAVEGGHVLVVVRRTLENGIECLVCNTGAPLTTQHSQGTGLPNTVSRLELLYGKSHDFRLWRQDNETRVRFLIPHQEMK